jgi:molybdenum cofactor biosynthesis protein B
LGPSSRRRVKSHGNLRFLVVTVSTSKYARKLQGGEINDESGDTAERIVRAAGGAVASRALISDDAQMLRERAKEFLMGKNDVAVFIGGTGVSPDDVTIESIRPFFEKELEGFGEILRAKSYERIGGAAFLTRATAGVSRGKLIVCLPGSPDAVATGLRTSIKDFPLVLSEARS